MRQMLFAKKSLDELLCAAGDKKHQLNRTLGPVQLILLGVGGIIGAGIFVMTGQAAALYAGPGIAISFVFSGLACAFAALCYAEFAAMIPISGSAYTYAYATLGEFVAWIIGWNLVLEYMFSAGCVAIGWSGYMVSFLNDFGIHLPPQIIAATGTPFVMVPEQGWQVFTKQLAASLTASGIDPASLPSATAVLNVPAMAIVAIITMVLIRGIKDSALFNDIIVAVKLAVVLLFIIFGFNYINTGNWVPFIPPNTGEWGHFGWSGIFRGAGVIFFAYIGFDAVSTAAQETKNPQRDLPIGIIGSLIICTILYILVALVLTGVVKYDQLLVPDPMAVGVDAAGQGLAWLRPFVKIGAIAGISSVVLVMLLGQPRIFFAMANDGLLPSFFSDVHPVHKTPYKSTILTGIIAGLIAGFVPIKILGELVSIGTLLAFAIVCIGILVLRHTDPLRPRPFKVPLVPLIPVLGAVTAFGQMLSLPWDTWLRLLVWTAIGLLIYFRYGIKNSKHRCTTSS